MCKRFFATAVLFLVCLWPHTSNATTVLYIVAPTGIAIGADGKTTNPDGTAMKIFLLKHRFALASIYTERATAKDGTTLYDFPSWVKVLEEKISSSTTVEEFSKIVAEQAPKTFSFAADAIRDGSIMQGEPGVENILVQYILAGYDSGVPTIYSVGLDIDWQHKKVVGPNRVLIQPEQGQRTDSRMGAFGQHVAIGEVSNPQSDAHRKAVSRLPSEYRSLNAGKELTLHQAGDMVRVILGIEAEANPKFVGFPLTVVTLPKSGHGSVRTFESAECASESQPEGSSGSRFVFPVLGRNWASQNRAGESKIPPSGGGSGKWLVKLRLSRNTPACGRVRFSTSWGLAQPEKGRMY